MEKNERMSNLSKQFIDNPDIQGQDLIKILLEMKGIVCNVQNGIHKEVQGR